MARLLSILLAGAVILAAGMYLTKYFFRGDFSPPAVAEGVGVVAEGLDIPWDFAFLPDGSLLVTEREGRLVEVGGAGAMRDVPLSGVRARGEGGLLGIVLHPDFRENHLLYLYMTTALASGTENRVVRFAYQGGVLSDERVIIEGIPGALYHDGGRIDFGPDGMLYITTGDAGVGANAQDTNSLAGKILRLNDDGSIPADNPFGNAVYSYGHRNPQGIAWDSAGRLWETEHGPTGERGRCCHDEVNVIVKGGNYGWPTRTGDETADGMVPPKVHSNTDTWAPASVAVWEDIEDRIFFGGLRGEALYETRLVGTSHEVVEYFKGAYGRIRTVRVGPDGFLYLTTSNRDGRGEPAAEDDRILRIDPKQLPDI